MTICPNCGSYVMAPAGAVQMQTIPSYLVQSILVTLCCCLPLGIVAIIFAAQVSTKLAAGDVAAAQQASNNARMWCWIAFGCGIVAAIIGVIANVGALLTGVHH